MLDLISARIIPGFSRLDAEGSRDFHEIVDRALMDRPEHIRRQFSIFLSLIRWAPGLHWGRPFDHLDGSRQDRVLSWLQDSAPDALRKGFWGLRTLVLMGYYGRDAAWIEVGYEPDFEGNRRLGGNA